MGDFNAQVGSRSGCNDEWWYGRGPHGYGDINEARKELLSFLSVNEVTICNTWFKKRDVRKQTWHHPKSKKWHCIDYVIVRQAHRRMCLDVSVMRGAECNSDHRMLRMKLAIGRRKRFGRKCDGVGVHRWDVSKLQGNNEDKQGRELARGRYLRCIGERIREQWDESSDTETKWSVLKAALCKEAKELGVEDNQIGFESVELRSSQS